MMNLLLSSVTHDFFHPLPQFSSISAATMNDLFLYQSYISLLLSSFPVTLMDSLGRPSSTCLLSLFLLVFVPIFVHGGGGVFAVKRKFVGSERPSISELKEHDNHRHARFLSTVPVDVPLSGHMRVGMYYTELAIGTPPKNFTVHVDTGSHELWVNCKDCEGCPVEDKAHGIHLASFDPHASETSKVITFGEGRCIIYPPDKTRPCRFQMKYADGTDIIGYYVTDLISYNQVSGDHQPARANATFGCVTNDKITKQSIVDLTIKQGVEGVLGFGDGNISLISQLASSGKVRGVFAHCLDTVKGGGIFAIGHVVQPKVKTTPLITPRASFYGILMMSIEAGGKLIELDSLDVTPVTMIDSGAATGIIPSAANDFLMKQIFSNHSDLKPFKAADDSTCVTYSQSIDEGFPAITFQFNMSLTLTVYPHDYLQSEEKDIWCLVWSTGPNDARFILGDLFLQNKLVIYDLENRVIGWTEHDCSKSIEVEDDKGGVCSIDAHGQDSASSYN